MLLPIAHVAPMVSEFLPPIHNLFLPLPPPRPYLALVNSFSSVGGESIEKQLRQIRFSPRVSYNILSFRD